MKRKIALVADWLTNLSGAEKVLEVLWRHFDKPPIYTTIHNPEKTKVFKDADIRTSFLDSFPGARHKHQLFLPWMPKAVESLNLDEYDVVISSSHSCAKGIITKPDTLHICYCHTPIRYAWEMHFDERMKTKNPLKKYMIEKLMHNIRIWDRFAADRVDHFIANSSFVAQRIKKYYRKDAEVIHPPVETSKFEISDNPKEYFLAVGRLIPYKKFDLIIKACNKLKVPLKIRGTGPEEKKLKSLAGDTIEFIGRLTDEELTKLYSECKAFILPQVEDFGIAPIEAMASGRPVIAYKKGGALDFVDDGKTGIFFEEQTEDALIEAIKRLDDIDFDQKKIKEHAEKFSTENFLTKINNTIDQLHHQ
jgi:glycosyltransferase involved in cell wall biosynthesis